MENCELHALEHKRYTNVHGHDCVGSGFYTGLIDLIHPVRRGVGPQGTTPQ